MLYVFLNPPSPLDREFKSGVPAELGEITDF